MKRGAWALITAGMLVLSACDGGTDPEGPGTLRASLRGPVDAGAAVLEVRGTGLGPVKGAGATSAFGAKVSEGGQGAPDVLRIVLVSEEPGELPFEIDVEDLAAELPTATVVSAVDGSDEPVSAPGAYEVTFERR